MISINESQPLLDPSGFSPIWERIVDFLPRQDANRLARVAWSLHHIVMSNAHFFQECQQFGTSEIHFVSKLISNSPTHGPYCRVARSIRATDDDCGQFRHC